MSEKSDLLRSLPPLVEGKVHGYVDLMIDEIVWSKKITVNNVIVTANWWGEIESAKFKPIDSNNYQHYPKQTNILTTYSIKTNIKLFKEYLKNSETIELVVMTEEHHQILGTAQITNLLEFLSDKSYSQYLPIFNDNAKKIGDVHVTLSLDVPQQDKKHLQKLKEQKLITTSELNKPQELNLFEENIISNNKDYDNTAMTLKSLNNLQNDNIYRSILKEKRFNVNSSRSKFDADITDKLVAQVVERAQKLRGVIMQGTNDYYYYDDDSQYPIGITKNSSFNSSSSSSIQSSLTGENEAALYKYFMGKNMSKFNEKKALKTLRKYSPTPSLIEFAAETVGHCRNESVSIDKNKYILNMEKSTNDDENQQDNYYENNYPSNKLNKKILNPIDYVDSLRIAVESLTLISAGYRRVKSSCLSRGDQVPISVTYFVQYNGFFGSNKKKTNNKIENKLVKMTSKKQIDQTIFFNNEAVYDLQKSYLHMDMPLKFNIYNRHLNQRTPSELGVGSVYIGDALKSSSLSSTQRLAIIKKGIKVGELKVTVELGCDKIHFGKNFVEAVTSTKENIPVLDIPSSNSSCNNTSTLIKSNQRFKTLTGNSNNTNSNKSKNNNTCSTTTASVSQSSTTTNDKNDKNNKKKISKEDEHTVKISKKKILEDKILLHGLIYIGEGIDIPSTSTYLVCRAFWREDRASSQVCNDTTNPFYNFHQLVPLIYGPELLERTKDNCIITEVYSKNPNGEDHFIGIIKLSLNQLYMAFRDSLILPHLLVSKYPVISVDGWVPITHPVTGKLCGQVSALVALGTAEQIAFLEMIRGLRNSSVTGKRISQRPTTSDLSNFNKELKYQETSNKINKQCQTEINPVINKTNNQVINQNKIDGKDDEKNNVLLNAIVDQLAQALSVPKKITNQQVQTSFELSVDKNNDDYQMPIDNETSLNFIEENNDIQQIKIHRSMGVGAEFIEPVDQLNINNSDTIVSTSEIKNTDDDDNNQENCDTEFVEVELFKALVEIDCALHLPQIESMGKFIDPCTYVTFQNVRSYSGDTKLFETQNVVTNVSLFDCNPKYDWSSTVKLSNDLLISDEKKLVFKVCRLVDDKTMIIDTDKDIIIGFATVDLSILTSGFSIVSGWFHIVDFNGKCNGQIKISVTPVDKISSLKKIETNSIPGYLSNFPYVSHQGDEKTDEILTKENPINSEAVLNIGLGLGDASMSFLSLSLNQKLGELDEIKKRLQSRLKGVTSNAFEDDFFNIDDNEFDMLEQDSDLDNHIYDDKNGNKNEDWLKQQNLIDENSKKNEHHVEILNQHISSENNSSRNNINSIDTGYSSTNIQSTARSLITNGNYNQYENQQDQLTRENHSNGFNNFPKLNENINGNSRNLNNEKLSNSSDKNDPIRGTKMHISHLLEQLSSQLTSSQTLPITNPPMKRSIMDIISSLRQHNNNYPNDMIKCNREANVRTIPTQTDDNKEEEEEKTESINNIDDEIPAKTQKREKIIIANNEIQNECNNIPTQIINSNNYLSYSQIDLSLDHLDSPNNNIDNNSVQSLTTHYRNTIDYSETDSNEIIQNNQISSALRNFEFELTNNIERNGISRVTPSGLSDNIDKNITVIENSCNNDLAVSESMESTTTISFDNTILQTDSEIDDNSSLNSLVTTSVSNVSRQAPDGGNPIEDPSKINTQNYLSDNDSSSTS